MFLSDTADPVFRYLLKEQEAAGFEADSSRRWPATEAQVQEYLKLARDLFQDEEFTRQFEMVLRRELPTPYTSPMEYALLQSTFLPLRRAVEQVPLTHRFRREGEWPPPFPAFGTLPLRSLQAEAVPVPKTDGKYVIVLNDGLFGLFATGASTAVATLALTRDEQGNVIDYDRSPEAARRERERNPQIAAGLSSAMVQLSAGVGIHRSVFVLDPASERFQLEFPLALSMLMFVAAHEYAHVVLNHQTDVRGSLQTLRYDASQSSPVPTLARSWRQEIEADYLGALLTFAALREAHEKNTGPTAGYPAELLLLAPYMLCDLSLFADETQEMYDTLKVPRGVRRDDYALGRAFAEAVVQDFESPGSVDPAKLKLPAIVPSTSHPPYWVRNHVAILAAKAWLKSESERNGGLSEVQKESARLAVALSQNIRDLWKAQRSVVLELCRTVKTDPVFRREIESLKRVP